MHKIISEGYILFVKICSKKESSSAYFLRTTSNPKIIEETIGYNNKTNLVLYFP